MVLPVTNLPSFHPFMEMDMPLLIRRSAEAHGDRTLMIWQAFDTEERRWTYAQVWKETLRIAQTFKELGVKRGDAIILHLENSPESVLTWLACAAIGAIAVTTNARCAGEELAYFAEKAGARGIVTQPAMEELVREHLPDIGWCHVASPGDGSLLAATSAAPAHPGPGHPLSVQFTSGTTSRPKGVLWTHANGLWGAMVNARHLQIDPDDILLITNPLFHTMPLAWQFLAAVWAGACVVIQPKFSASRFWTTVQQHQCTRATIGLFHIGALAAHPTPSQHSLRLNNCGLSFANPENYFGIRSFGAYGMTELITQPVFNDPHSVLDEGSIGRPAPEYEIRVARDDGAECRIGEMGELLVKGVRGLSLFAGYLGDPDATAQAFTEDGFFKTGDLVTVRADGAFVFSGRLKDMLKIGGENVAASEIETVIKEIDGVQEVAVVGQPHPMLSEVPYAFVILQPSASEDVIEQATRACAERLADFKRPRGYRVVEDLPRSSGVKVAKVELRRILREEANL